MKLIGRSKVFRFISCKADPISRDYEGGDLTDVMMCYIHDYVFLSTMYEYFISKYMSNNEVAPWLWASPYQVYNYFCERSLLLFELV